MKLSNAFYISAISILVALAANPAEAAKGGKGKGGGGNGGGGGGSGFDTPVEIHLAISFRDTAGDRVQSDGGVYIDGDLGITGEDPDMDAHIDASAGANYGNLYLRTTGTVSRSLFLDISDCLADCDSQPFSAEYLHSAAFTVAATHSLSGGFCGMNTGQTITAPMQITYNLPGIEQPGFVHFEPGLKGKSPCKGNNGSSEVTVVRDSATEWTVSGDAACVAAPYGDPGGVVFMPFEFTAVGHQACN